jgi:nickel/cobalt transporter (NiCoT) family protein
MRAVPVDADWPNGFMLRMLGRIFDDQPVDTRVKVAVLYAVLLAANVLAWLWALIAFRQYPVLLGTALLAYTFGLRHAVDADHIAAIDNVTRKLMQAGKRPISVGFFFSLGHSTVVIVASVFVALAVSALQSKFDHFKEIGGVIGTSVSAFFLIVIAGANTVILVGVWRMFNAVRRGEHLVEEDLDILLSQRSFLGRLLRSFFGMISKSWHMYPLGILFGLGFDTATEIGLWPRWRLLDIHRCAQRKLRRPRLSDYRHFPGVLVGFGCHLSAQAVRRNGSAGRRTSTGLDF